MRSEDKRTNDEPYHRYSHCTRDMQRTLPEIIRRGSGE